MKGLASPSLDCKGLMVLIDMILEDLPTIEILLQDSFVQELVIQFIQPLCSSLNVCLSLLVQLVVNPRTACYNYFYGSFIKFFLTI